MKNYKRNFLNGNQLEDGKKDPDFVGRLSSDDPVDPADIDKHIATVCEEETVKAYDRSKKGLAI